MNASHEAAAANYSRYIAAARALPFVAADGRPGLPESFWALPVRGDLMQGSRDGAAAAEAALALIAGQEHQGPTLYRAMLDWAKRWESAGPTEREILEGQLMGFQSVIQRAARGGAQLSDGVAA